MPVQNTEPRSTFASGLKQRISRALQEARERTLLLIEPVSDTDLLRQHDPLMSPIIWDIGHIAHFEELWLTRNLDGLIEFSEMPGIYNPFENPRALRGALPLKPRSEILQILEDIRNRVLEKLESADLDDSNPLLHDGYVYYMVLQHEYQHNETILQTLQLKQGEPYRAPRVREYSYPKAASMDGMVRFPGGTLRIGTDDRIFAYDNERPHYELELSPFWIDRAPVSNADYLSFIRDRGYSREEIWSAGGKQWLAETGTNAPKHWEKRGDEWWTRSMDRTTPVDPLRPVIHVCYYEAEAFSKWAGKRLPTEFEWEAAASWDPSTRSQRKYPWGESDWSDSLANLDQLAFDTCPIGTFATSLSPIGCHGMIGDVWEWTSSNFNGYPGFEVFPYPEYSQVFFGTEYKVLRGGSWATRPGAIRNTFRNWDYPVRRQIFSGFRCARDD